MKREEAKRKLIFAQLLKEGERWRAAAGSSERPQGREEELRKVPPPQGHGCRKAQGESPGNGAETIPSLACAMIPKG